MIHLYIGDGKGKTTAALGLALRANGCGGRVYIAQFLKNKDIFCGEIEAVKKYKMNIVIERFDNQIHPMFLKNKEKFNLAETKKTTKAVFKKISGFISRKKFDVIILDEILNLLEAGFMPPALLYNFLNKAKKIEVILTGRLAPAGIIEKADYISFIKKIKHPFDKNILARKGIEF